MTELQIKSPIKCIRFDNNKIEVFLDDVDQNLLQFTPDFQAGNFVGFNVVADNLSAEPTHDSVMSKDFDTLTTKDIDFLFSRYLKFPDVNRQEYQAYERYCSYTDYRLNRTR